MKVFGVLVLLATLSAADGLRCYVCAFANPNSCTEVMTCPAGFDRCANVVTGDLVTKSCYSSAACVSAANCCSTDLCNGAITTGSITTGSITTGSITTGSITSGSITTGATPIGSSVLLLLVSSAITSVFL